MMMGETMLTLKELEEINDERELRIIIALRTCSRCRYRDSCFRRDYCKKIYYYYDKYLKIWRYIKSRRK